MYSKELKLLEAARGLAQQVAPLQADPGSTAGAAERFPAEVMGALSQAVCDRLGHYHRDVGDPREMKGLLELLAAAEGARGRGEQLPVTLEACIRTSMEAAFADADAELASNVAVGEARVQAAWGCLPMASPLLKRPPTHTLP